MIVSTTAKALWRGGGGEGLGVRGWEGLGVRGWEGLGVRG